MIPPHLYVLILFLINGSIAASVFQNLGLTDPRQALFAALIAHGFGMVATLIVLGL